MPGRIPPSASVWVHRGLAAFFALLTIPAVLWWRDSVMFVILLSLATQVSTEVGTANAANDQAVTDRLAHVEAQLDALLEQRRRTHDQHGDGLQP